MLFNKHKLRAVSLVEVLVVLALVASSMVGIAGVNVRAQLAVKDNETLDLANGAMLQALELAKSPAGIKLVNSGGGPYSGPPAGKYSIDNNAKDALVRRLDTDPELSTSSPCDNSSNYYVSPSVSTKTTTITNRNNICLQVEITQKQRPLTTSTYYEIKSIVLITLSSGPITNQLIAYRREPFN